MAAELSRRGLVAVDADGFAGWESAAGAEVDQPENADDDWLLSHRWVWRRALLERFVSTQPAGEHVFVCGIAMNQRAMLDIFDEVFLLRLDHSTQLGRLDTVSNAHRTAALRAQILDGRPVFQQEMVASGARVLDGRQPTSLLADQILRMVSRA